jgi:membrane protease YdiL (CAAX protease family)
MSETNTPDRQTIVRLAILVEGGLIVLSWLLGWLMRQEPLARFHWDGLDALRGLAATLPLLVLFLLMTRWPVGPLARIKQFSNEVIRPLLAPCTLVDLIGISVLAGLGEEMLFRGVFQGAFTRWFGNPWLGVALASILFGLLHAITLTYALLAALMSVYLGWLWNVTDNLLVVVIVHGLYDFLVLLYLLRGPGSSSTVERPSEDVARQSADAEAPPEDAESLP